MMKPASPAPTEKSPSPSELIRLEEWRLHRLDILEAENAALLLELIPLRIEVIALRSEIEPIRRLRAEVRNQGPSAWENLAMQQKILKSSKSR